MFDDRNTKDWQQDGNGVYLLQECDPPAFRSGHPLCENRFSIHVQSKNRIDRAGEVEIAKRIATALNGGAWQSDRPTEQFDGAKWAKRETPADPFAEVG